MLILANIKSLSSRFYLRAIKVISISIYDICTYIMIICLNLINAGFMTGICQQQIMLS